MHPLDELKALDRRIDQIRNLAELRPVFYRLDELTRQHSDDFEVQLAASEVKQRVIARGTTLRALGQTLHDAPPLTATAPKGPPPVPAVNGDTETLLRLPTASYPASAASDPAREAPPARPIVLKPIAPPRTEGPFPVPGSPMKRPLLIGAICGAIVAALLIGFLVSRSRMRSSPSSAVIPLAVVTVPDGAAIRVNGEQKCISNCSVAVPPGDYQVTAFLDGYEPAAGNVRVSVKQPGELSLTLTPQAQTVRVLADGGQGKITFDDQSPADLQDGQFVFEHVTAGKHQVKVTTKSGEASFAFEIANAAMPTLVGPIAARDVTALLVSTVGNRARAVTNTVAKLALNGGAPVDAGPDGVNLSGFHAGVSEFMLSDANGSRIMSETFGPAPELTVFLKSEVSTGTLVISTGEDDTRVFLNGKEYGRKTKKGELRIQTIGTLAVRVAKDGFEVAPPQNADVKKGAETRLAFKLQPIPTVGSLLIRGGTPGAEVLIDQKFAGTIGDDGTLTLGAVPPGDHLVEVKKDQFVPRRFQRPFSAGQTVALSAGDVFLNSAVGTVHVARTPSDAAVFYRRTDETQLREMKGDQIALPPGNYIFTARSPGFNEKAERVQVTMGETNSLELALAKVTVAAPPPAPKSGGMIDFEDPNSWTKQGDLWVHKGGGFIPYRLSANGTFTFTVRLLKGGSLFRGGRIRWAAQYNDAKNYALFEMDRKSLSSKVIEDGKPYDRGKYDHGLSDKEMSYTIQVDIAPGQMIHRIMNNGQWQVLDTWKEPGRNFSQGKFGFIVQGNDEIGLTDFKFAPH